MAAFEEGLHRLSEAVQEAAGHEGYWLERVRAGLVALLGFLEDEPEWGRLLVLQAPLDCAAALRCQQRLFGVLTVLVTDGSPGETAESVPELGLMAELVIGGVFSVIRTRMLEVSDGSFVELAPSLMAFIVGPYLGRTVADAELAGRSDVVEQPRSRVAGSAAVPPPVPFRLHYRSALVLRVIACAPRSSNREIAEAAGLTDKGQMSHLLRRLARDGLIEKVPSRSGSRRENAWLLTPHGRRLIKLLGVEAAAGPRDSASVRVMAAA